ncbi:MAG: hypothetical protein ACJ790_20650, partial [Myxococcaceae bacterium]
MKRLWMALLLCSLAACINFDNSRDDFCEKRPDVCFGDGGVGGGGGNGNDGGTDAGIDAGLGDAGLDAGEDGGTDAGVDAGFDAGIDAGFDAGVDAGPIPGWSVRVGGPFCVNELTLVGLGQNSSGQVTVAGTADGVCDVTGSGAAQAYSSAFFTLFEPDGGADLV